MGSNNSMKQVEDENNNKKKQTLPKIRSSRLFQVILEFYIKKIEIYFSSN